jgi:large subunit ribosomal protein L11e
VASDYENSNLLFTNPFKPSNRITAIRGANLCIAINSAILGDKVDQAARLIEELTDQKAMTTRSTCAVLKLGIRHHDKVDAFVTVRGAKARAILVRALEVQLYQLKRHFFSQDGNISFSVQKHTGLGFDDHPEIGMHVIEIEIVLERPSFPLLVGRLTDRGSVTRRA